MYLHSYANRVPERSFRQHELWEIYRDSETRKRLLPRSVWIVDKVLNGENGVEKRHFALEDVAALPEMGPEELNRRFEREAPKLAGAALADALETAGLDAEALDALIVCTCTGYLCPGVSSHVAEALGLRPDAYLVDIVGQGCGAAVPAVRNAAQLLRGDPEARVATVAVEVCSAAFYVDDDPGVLVSACLFGDGAAAAVWSGDESEGTGLKAYDFDTLHLPEERQILRFENRGGKLRNRLERCVPEQAAKAVRALYERSRSREPRPVQQVISHAGGREVVEAIERELSLPPLKPTREALRLYGNMSSPSVLFALEAFLRSEELEEGKDLWLTSFGAGFAAHSFRLGRF